MRLFFMNLGYLCPLFVKFGLKSSLFYNTTIISYTSAMLVEVLYAKIHRVKITQLELNYVGSITIDEDLLDASGMFVNQKVQIVNVNNGARFETYIIKGERGSGIIGLNGPAARLAAIGDVIIILSYAQMELAAAKAHEPAVVFPDGHNKLLN